MGIRGNEGIGVQRLKGSGRARGKGILIDQ